MKQFARLSALLLLAGILAGLCGCSSQQESKTVPYDASKASGGTGANGKKTLPMPPP